ncbi:DUF6492 family protein [Helicobacter sp. MIT 14-3879]|uniref:DUF6492 family protein n=1 Tax=Helicobacter sp. MIT 14-3879 TaxID=2040649 RepID=UPI000E1EF896|nr:DUF6492 family protein [Helicobacter sp. MIT 14-3879]RDU64777.1 hypothetical protein CQA44_03440 [Helicobacter sp. MIT 14-3879]
MQHKNGGGGQQNKNDTKNIEKYREITYSDIVVIANRELKNKVKQINTNIEFINEDSLIENLTYKHIESMLIDSKPTGWFFQQFLKMAYCFISYDDFYLSWDCDSLLIKKLHISNVFLNALPIYIKPNHPYYTTINKLLDIKIDNNHQFMCEFMIFNKNIMRDLCSKLNPKNTKEFYKPIIDLVNIDNKIYSFSEFETYANYAINNYDIYKLSYYPVYRCGGRFYDKIPPLDEPLVKDFAKTYYVLQFNHWDKKVPFAKILHNKTLRKIIGFKNLMRIYYYSGLYKKDFNLLALQ